jgi:hypothetical protein
LSFQAPATFPVTISASKFDDLVASIHVQGSDGTTLDSSIALLGANSGPLPSGHYSVTASARLW